MDENIKYWLSRLETSECCAPLFAVVIAELIKAI